MLISQEIKIEVTHQNLKYHQRTKKDLVVGDIVIIPLTELSPNSGLRVEVECDYCQSHFITEYRKYLRSIQIIHKSACKKKECVDLKTKESNQVKYGVSNVMQLESSKSKAKRTNLVRFGVEHPMKLDEFKDKIKEANLEKFGVEHPMYLDEIKDKIRRTNLEKFGVRNPMQSEIVKNRLRDSNLEKFGVDNYTKTEEYKVKAKQTNLEKFGVDNYTKTEEYKEKTKKTNLERFGTQYTSQSEEFRRKNFNIAQHLNYLQYLIGEGVSEFQCDCNKNHTFKIDIINFRHRSESNNPLCTECYPIGDSRSIKEVELFKIIQSYYEGEIIQSYRDGMEIDIYLPDLKLGFEFNGLYWHSNLYREKNYHWDKTRFFQEQGIRIIHLWEDDFQFRKDILISQLKNILERSEDRILARKCQVIEIDSKKYSQFLLENHLQGSVGSVIKLGLYYQNTLVSVMGFDQFEGRKKMESGGWNLNRFCTKLNTNVIGGASKLLEFFIRKYQPIRIISYADRDWSVGSLYEKLGFVKISESKPDYKYIVNGKRIHKSNFKKSISGISESKLDILRVYDCGKIKYEKKIKKKGEN